MKKYLFSVVVGYGYDEIDRTEVMITTKEHWLKEKCCDDSSLEDENLDRLLNELNLYEAMESVFHTHRKPEEVFKRLSESNYFEFDENFQEFAIRCSSVKRDWRSIKTEMYFPLEKIRFDVPINIKYYFSFKFYDLENNLIKNEDYIRYSGFKKSKKKLILNLCDVVYRQKVKFKNTDKENHYKVLESQLFGKCLGFFVIEECNNVFIK
jgi:hypothetical protein